MLDDNCSEILHFSFLALSNVTCIIFEFNFKVQGKKNKQTARGASPLPSMPLPEKCLFLFGDRLSLLSFQFTQAGLCKTTEFLPQGGGI